MYKLVVSDLDGTLLTPEHRLGDYTRGVLGRLRTAGIDLVLASGRHFMDIRVLATQLGGGDAAGGGCLISCNGAAVNAPNGDLVQATCLDPEVVDFLLHDPLFSRFHINAFRTDAWLVERAEPSLLRYHQDSGFRYEVVEFNHIDRDRILKIFYYGDHERLLETEQALIERHGERISTTFSLPETLEVMSAGVSKGDALASLLERRGLSPAEVVCAGDGMNDLEMLRLVAEGGGLALVMDNADARLHRALPDLPRAGRNGDEAIAKRLARLLDDGLLAN